MLFRKLVLTASAATLLSWSPAQSATTLNFAAWIPWTHSLSVNLYIKWAEAVEKASNGEIKIHRLPKGIGHPRAYLDAVRTGQIDIGFGTHGYSPKRFAAYQFTDFPLLGNRASATSQALQRTHDKFFADKGFYKGVKLVGVNTLGPGIFMHAKKIMQSPADMKGQKFRTGGPIQRRVVEGLGGIAVSQPITKVYELLSTGIVDGNMGRFEQIAGFKLTSQTPFVTTVPGGLSSASMYMLVNQKKFDGLSAAGKKAINDLSGDAWAKMAGEAWDKINDEGQEVGVKAGVKIATAGKPVVDALAKLNAEFEKAYATLVKKQGIDGAAVLQYFHGEVKKLEGK